MFKQFIGNIAGADICMITSFLTFFVFFLLVSLYLIFSNNKEMKKMAELPLEGNN